MFTTLITPAELAARLADPAYVVVDVRHDLARPERWGEDQFAAGHLPGARFAHIDRDLSAQKTGRNGRHPLPSPDAAAALFGRLGIAAGHAGRRLRPGQRHVRFAAVVDAALARPRRRRGARRRLRALDARRPAGDHGRAAAVARDVRPWTRAAHGVRGRDRKCARGRRTDAGRRAGTGALSRRRRAARPCRRTHSRGAQPPLRREREPGCDLQACRHAAPRVRRAARRDAARPGRALLRQRRDRLPQRAGHGDRRPAGHAALSRLLERVVRGPCPPRRDGRRVLTR